MIYVITGHLGSGKSLLAIRIAHDYLKAGKKVASNITLNLDKLMPEASRLTATKLPYIPTAEHLNLLGSAYEGAYDEEKFGLLILDEAGTWLNSRDWNDKDRRGLFQWITHARKLGWDVALIVQDFEALDSQIRRSVTEVHVKCSRTDRIKLPFIPVTAPKFHIATARYQSPSGSIFKRWTARGDDYYDAYNTREAVKQEITYTEAGPIDARAPFTMLSAWHLRGRYLPDPAHPSLYVFTALKWVLVFTLTMLFFPLASRSGVRGKKRMSEQFMNDWKNLFPRHYWKQPEWMKTTHQTA